MLILKRQHIFLIGLSGSGKSTVGKILAKKLKRTFVDIDKMIERNTGKSIIRIFEEDGEPSFRKMETVAIGKVARKYSRPKVVALGGGAFESSANQKLIIASGISIWLRCPINELSKRMKSNSDRPLLKGPDLKRRLSSQLKNRISNYRKADLQLSFARKTPGQVSGEIITMLNKKYAAN